jgi:plastocyanin
MKNTFVLIALAIQSLFIMNTAYATVHIITAEGTTIPTDIFKPGITNAFVGDTIKWVLIDGDHTTESVDVPAGAATWFGYLSGNDSVFIYVVTVAGSYYYDCHHYIGGHGMDGYIEVAELTTGISDNKSNIVSQVYPNPFSDKIIIESADTESVSVYNIAGKEIKSVSLFSGQPQLEVDMIDVTKGIYFYSIRKNDLVISSGKLIKN